MKILMSNGRDQYTLAPQYFNALNNYDVALEAFYPLDIVEGYLAKSSNKILQYILPNQLANKINNDLLEKVDAFKPDIVFVVKGFYLKYSTLMQIKTLGIKLVNYNPDHPFNLGGKQISRNIKESVSLYDVYISYSKKIQEEIHQIYPNLKTEIIPFGFPDDVPSKLKKSKDIQKLCFIGTADAYRARMIKAILKKEIPVDLYGNKWHRYFSDNDLVSLHDKKTGLEYFQILRDYRVQLNLFREQNLGSHNMRSFEIAASGGIMLGPNDSDHSAFFNAGEHYYNFDSEADLVEKTKEILGFHSEKANEIREKIQIKCIANDYSYKQRSKQLYSIFTQLLE